MTTNSNESTSSQSNLNSLIRKTPVKNKLLTMLKIQESLNQRLNADWRKANYKWRDAIMVEATELFDHLPWKWWKASAKNIDWGQVNLEAVDIWHFILSEALQDGSEGAMGTLVERLTTTHLQMSAKPQEPLEVAYWTRELIRTAMAGDTHAGRLAVMTEDFKCLLDSLGMSVEALYKLYVSKAKLNEFRWANKYGTDYVKDWLGQEDNQYLTELIEKLDVDDELFADKITEGLTARYEEVLAAKALEVEAYKERVLEVL